MKLPRSVIFFGTLFLKKSIVVCVRAMVSYSLNLRFLVIMSLKNLTYEGICSNASRNEMLIWSYFSTSRNFLNYCLSRFFFRRPQNRGGNNGSDDDACFDISLRYASRVEVSTSLFFCTSLFWKEEESLVKEMTKGEVAVLFGCSFIVFDTEVEGLHCFLSSSCLCC